jgi:hypothetical protein
LQEIDEIQGDLRLYPRDSDQPRYVRRDS